MTPARPALAVLESAHAAAAAAGPAAELPALNDFALALASREPARALQLAQRAQELAREHGGDGALARALLAQASARFHLGQHEHALSRALAARVHCEEAGDREAMTTLFAVLGDIHFWMGDHSAALEHHYQCLRLSEETGRRDDEAAALATIGAIYARTGDHDKGVDYALRSLRLLERLGDREGEAAAYCALGDIYERMGAGEKARDYFEKALALFSALGDRRREGRALGRLAAFEIKRGRRDEAEQALRDSLAVAREFGDRATEIQDLIALAGLRGGAGAHEAAITTLGDALALAGEARNRALVAEVHLALAGAHEAAGDAASALRHYHKQDRLRRELSGEEHQARTRVLQVRLELERTAQENLAMHMRNAELQGAARKLESLVQTLNELNEQKNELLDRLRQQTEALDRLSKEDALTGLANRRQLQTVLAQEFARARRFGRSLSVAIADLDHFKRVNDRHSHLSGDEVLRVTARLLREALRQVDVVARYGGEEFVLVLPETPPAQAAVICEKIRETVERHPWGEIHPGLMVTLSIGIAGDLEVAHEEKLLSLADEKLYEAKAAGRNRVIY